MGRFRSVYDPGDAIIAGDVTLLEGKFPIDTPDIKDDAITNVKVAPTAIGPTELATDAVTNPKVAPNALDGETIQTSTTGQRVVLDAAGDAISMYSGVANEVLPSKIDPVGGFPQLSISSGTTTTRTDQSSLLLTTGFAGGGLTQLTATNIELIGNTETNDLQCIDLTMSGIGSGAGFDTWQVACSSNATATSTTNVTIPGFSQSVTSPGTSAVYMVHFDIAWATAAGTSSIIELLVDGSAQTIQMTQNTTSLDSLSAHKVWRITGLSAGSHTFTGRVRNTASSTTAIVGATNSTMTIERKA